MEEAKDTREELADQAMVIAEQHAMLAEDPPAMFCALLFRHVFQTSMLSHSCLHEDKTATMERNEEQQTEHLIADTILWGSIQRDLKKAVEKEAKVEIRQRHVREAGVTQRGMSGIVSGISRTFPFSLMHVTCFSDPSSLVSRVSLVRRALAFSLT